MTSVAEAYIYLTLTALSGFTQEGTAAILFSMNHGIFCSKYQKDDGLEIDYYEGNWLSIASNETEWLG